MKKDLFGFETQGKKYDIYRPKYPPQLLKQLIEKTKGRNRYLDVATGTGQILFEIFQHFKYSEGIDISKKMIDVCHQKVKQKGITNVQFRCEDFLKTKITQTFDLITVGQALHWLPIREFLQKCKYSLTPQGKLAVFGYILNKVQGQTPEQSNKLNKIYEQFYDGKVKKNFDFDRDELHTHYSDKTRYPFEQVFDKVHREIVEVPIMMDKNGFISYLKTYSGYNTYLQRFPDKEDPIIPLQKQIEENSQLKVLFDYFCITCDL